MAGAEKLRHEYGVSGVLSPNLQPPSNDEENVRQVQNDGHSTKYLKNTPQNGEGHENKERL